MSVSIVIPAYNAASFLLETIESLVHQLDESDEIIVVDDGSTDNTKNIVEGVADKRIRYLYQNNSGGPASPRNHGCRAARGDIVFIFDSDDIAHPEKIRSSVNALNKHPEIGFLFTNFDMIDERAQLLCKRYVDRYGALDALLTIPSGENLYRVSKSALLSALFSANFVGTSSVAFRRKIWQKTKGFDESLLNLDDRDMWIQLCLESDALFLDRSLHRYRNREGSVSKQRIKQQLHERIAVAQKYQWIGLGSELRGQIRVFKAKTYLKLGYVEFHEEGNRKRALFAFYNSFIRAPGKYSLKGVIKSSLPVWIYALLR